MTLGAAEQLALDDAREQRPDARVIAVIGTSDLGAAVLAAFENAEVRVFNDIAAPGGAEPGADALAKTLTGAELVIGEPPKSLAELDEIAQQAATSATPDVVVVLAGREKHLNRGMNETLGRSFEQVSASRGRAKSRALRARVPRAAVALTYPRHTMQPELGFAIYAHGATFSGPKLDIGTRELLAAFDDVLAHHSGDVRDVVDLGCGSGVLATVAAQRLAEAHVIATDRSWAAVQSARLTAEHAGVDDRVRVTQDDAGSRLADSSADLILFNPPFHDGTTVDEQMAERMFRAAARILRPQGTLAVVFNSHLPHRGALQRIVGQTTQLRRSPKFTVTVSVRR